MKNLPFSREQIQNIITQYPTPFHLYDETGIRKSARALKKAFSNMPFRNYFAVKALPNPHIMSILSEEGMGMDASSLSELLLCERVGIQGEDIMFSSNDTAYEEYQKANSLSAIINLDDIGHISYLEKYLDALPQLVCLRYNPGSSKKASSQAFIIGKPEEAKFGVTKEQLLKGYQILKKKRIKRFGIHTMPASNELHLEYFLDTASMMFALVEELSKKLDISFDFVNLGGGIGIPYKPSQKALDLAKLAGGIKKLYEKALQKGIKPFNIYMENGRMVTGPHGYLISRVLHVKHTYKTFVGLDSSMANLMRPGMYGAYHQITILGKENKLEEKSYDVVGSLCENNDKFAINRKLPAVSAGDILVIHDTGAHGHAMGFNYNGKLRSAEVLLKKDGRVKLIRRGETPDDYFKTLV